MMRTHKNPGPVHLTAYPRSRHILWHVRFINRSLAVLERPYCTSLWSEQDSDESAKKEGIDRVIVLIPILFQVVLLLGSPSWYL